MSTKNFGYTKKLKSTPCCQKSNNWPLKKKQIIGIRLNKKTAISVLYLFFGDNKIGNNDNSIKSGWVQKASDENRMSRMVETFDFSSHPRIIGKTIQKILPINMAEKVSLKTKLPWYKLKNTDNKMIQAEKQNLDRKFLYDKNTKILFSR